MSVLVMDAVQGTGCDEAGRDEAGQEALVLRQLTNLRGTAMKEEQLQGDRPTRGKKIDRSIGVAFCLARGL